MDEAISVRDVMNRSYVGVSEGDSVSGAAQLMRDEGVNSVVVLRGREPVGMLSAADVVALVADDRDPSAASVGEEMEESVESIDADRRLSDAIGAFAADDARRMIVTEGDEVVGLLSEHDIVTTHAVLTTREAAGEPPVASGAAGEVGAVDPAEAVEAAEVGGPVSLENEEFATQGVCEACGALTRDLSYHDGQLLCADCLDM